MPSIAEPIKKLAQAGLALTNGRRITWALLAILVVAALLRVYGLDWDSDYGANPHPDERHLASTMTRISLPQPLTLRTLLNADTSSLNPRRVNPADGNHYDLAYGTLPIYIIRAAAALLGKIGYPSLDSYDGFYTVGRATTVVFALITVLLAFKIGQRVFGQGAGLLGSALLAVSVAHIQLSHFMTVDLALTMFITGGLYWALCFAQEGRRRDALLLGASLGGAMACKISGATLLAAVLAAFLLWRLQPRRHINSFMGNLAEYALLVLAGFALLFGTFEFYVLLSPLPYLKALANQSQMVSGANDWPFTRQYVNTAPYLYHLDNLVRWGLGWPLGIAAIAAVIVFSFRLLMLFLRSLRSPMAAPAPRHRWPGRLGLLLFAKPSVWGTALLLSWCLAYFAYIGRLEVKFVRYLLPLVPALCALGGAWVIRLGALLGKIVERLLATRWGAEHLGERNDRAALYTQIATILLVIAPTAVYALAFMSIYRAPHTWQQASRWLYANAPEGSTISSEIWDDSLPVDIPLEGRYRNYFQTDVSFDIYGDMPAESKFQQLTQAMRRTDYIVLATPRLYGAVRRLPWRYPVEIRYYELLFQEKLGYELAYAAMSYPQIWGLTFVDDAADESFGVYDHPKALIYRKVRDLPEAELRGLFGDVLTAKPVVTRRGESPPVKLPTPAYRLSLMLDTPVSELPAVRDYAWNRWASSGTIPATLMWLLVLTLVSLAALPISWLVFGRFAERGYLLAKPLALLLISYLTWMPVSLGLWHYTVWAVLLACGLVAVCSYWIISRRRLAWNAFWRGERKLILLAELVFLAAFAVSLLLRLGNPDLWHPVNGGEKPMEFGFLNAILRSPTMPPYDPFFSDGYINYYYYGLFVVSTLVKLTGIAPSIAFNLIIPTLFAMTAGGAYAIVATLTGRRLWGLWGSLLTTFAGPLSGALTIRGRGGFGEVIGALQRLAATNTQGALAKTFQGAARWIGGAVLPLRSDWFWDASRTHGVYENTITEFPFWSFLFADLHPHTINIPFTILAIALALRLAQGCGSVKISDLAPSSADAGSGKMPDLQNLPALPLLALTAIVLGALAIANSWDFPTFALLAVGGVALAHWFGNAQSVWRRLFRTMAAVLFGAALLLPLSLGLYFPFFTHFHAFVKGIGLVKYPTEVNYYVGFFGVSLFLIASYALWQVGKRSRSNKMPDLATGAGTPENWSGKMPDLQNQAGKSIQQAMDEIALAEDAPVEQAFELAPPPTTNEELAPSPTTGVAQARKLALPTIMWRALLTQQWHWVLAVALFLATSIAAWALYPSINLKQLATFWLLAELLLFTFLALMRKEASALERFACWLAIVGLLVSLGVEVIYIRDHLGDTWYRMNTIFKFYVHTWVILAIAGASALGYFWSSRWPRGQSFLAPIWLGGLAVMLLAVLIYPIFATQSRWRDRFPVPPEWGTLDGLAYMESAEYSWDNHQISLAPDHQAIQWLIDNIEGTPVIAQAPYGFYRENGVRIAVNTGYPTILNPLHENEQRYDEMIGPRHRDADNLYKSADVAETVKLLARYGVGYVYVGPFEDSVYPAARAKFDAMLDGYLDLVYDEEQVRIYEVRAETRAAQGGAFMDAAKAVVVPTAQPRVETISKDELKNLERAASASPDNPNLQFDLGNRYRQAGRFEDAVKVFERSLKYHPEDVAMYHTLGDTYLQMGKPLQAIEQYIRATEAAPKNPAAFNKLGVAYLDLQQPQEAVEPFKNALAIDAKFAEAAFHLGEAYEQLGNKAAAIDAYKQAIQQGAGSDWATRSAERLKALGN